MPSLVTARLERWPGAALSIPLPNICALHIATLPTVDALDFLAQLSGAALHLQCLSIGTRDMDVSPPDTFAILPRNLAFGALLYLHMNGSGCDFVTIIFKSLSAPKLRSLHLTEFGDYHGDASELRELFRRKEELLPSLENLTVLGCYGVGNEFSLLLFWLPSLRSLMPARREQLHEPMATFRDAHPVGRCGLPCHRLQTLKIGTGRVDLCLDVYAFMHLVQRRTRFTSLKEVVLGLSTRRTGSS